MTQYAVGLPYIKIFSVGILKAATFNYFLHTGKFRGTILH